MSEEMGGGQRPCCNVAIIVGSLRRESYTRRVAMAVAKLAPPMLQFHVVEIGDLPL